MTRQISAVLVGCGGISQAWLESEAARKRVKIVGLSDINRKNAEAAAERNKLKVPVDTDLARLLKQTKPDAVFDCTIPSAHCSTTLTALKHGCHVLGEKPMAETLGEARKMVAAAKKSGKIYAVIQNRRYLPEIRSLKAFLMSGKIGDITTVQSNFFIGAHFGGFRDEMKHVLLLDMAIHTFDQARMISGADGVSVFAHDWNPKGSWYKHGASAVAMFKMTNNIVYTYEGSWAAEGCHTSWEASWRIIGTKGTVLWDGASGFRAETVTATGGFHSKTKEVKVPMTCPKKLTGGHSGVINAFVDSVISGKQPETSCYDNARSIAMVHAAVESAEKGRMVKVARF